MNEAMSVRLTVTHLFLFRVGTAMEIPNNEAKKKKK